MGKWRFILFRGIVGFGVPMFLFLALSDLSENIQMTHAFHHPMVRYLLGHWLAGFCMSARQLVSWLACLHGGELCRTCGRVPSPTLSPVPSPWGSLADNDERAAHRRIIGANFLVSNILPITCLFSIFCELFLVPRLSNSLRINILLRMAEKSFRSTLRRIVALGRSTAPRKLDPAWLCVE